MPVADARAPPGVRHGRSSWPHSALATGAHQGLAIEFPSAFRVAQCRQQCRRIATPPSIRKIPQSAGHLPCMVLLTHPELLECEAIGQEKLLTLSCGIKVAPQKA
jgi:hypothetical protein